MTDFTLVNTLSEILQTAISPVALISGVGLLLLSMTNRFTSTLSRMRSLAETSRPASPERKKQMAVQIAILFRRSEKQRTAISLAILSVLCACVIVVCLFGMGFFAWPLTWFVLFLFTLSLMLLVISLFFFFQDIQMSLNALEEELRQKIEE